MCKNVLPSLLFLSLQPAKSLPRTLYLWPEPKNLMFRRTNIHLKTKTAIIEMSLQICVKVTLFQFSMKLHIQLYIETNCDT